MSSTSLHAAQSRYRFDVPPGLLATAISQIGSLSGASIATSDPSLLRGSSKAVHLEGTTSEALAALLKGTPAWAKRVGATSWRIVARLPARTSPTKTEVMPASSEILVTAAKRDLPLSTYPATISLISGPSLDRFGATPDVETLGRILPSLQSTHLGPGRDKLFLRGIADSSFNGSSAALVGLYLNDLRLSYYTPQPDLRFYDVSRVEILEGSQGTLYGAGSLAGLVRVTPNEPDLGGPSAAMWLGGTTTAHGAPGGDIGGIVNLPLLRSRAGLRVVGYAAHDGGYIDDVGRARNDVNATRTIGGRATLRVELGADWHIDLGGIAQDIQNRDAQYADRSLPTLIRSSTAAQPSSNIFEAGDFVVQGSMPGSQLSSTTGIIHQYLRQHFLPDDGNTASVYSQQDRVDFLSEELRLSNRGGSRLSWVAGLALLDGRTDQTRSSSLAGFDRSLGRARTALTDLTGFGELTTHLSSSLELTAGVRVSAVRLSGLASGAEEKSLVAAKEPPGAPPHLHAIRHEHFAVPTLALAWSPTTSWVIFTRYSQGYRPGGQTASGIIERFDADHMDSLETGLRYGQQDAGYLSLELAAAISWWRNVQADILGANGLPITQNIGDGIVRSFTLRARWTILACLEARLAATLARGYVKGRDPILDVVVRTSLPNVARDTVAASLNYSQDIDGRHRIILGVSLHHVGHSVLGSGSGLSEIRQGGFWLLSSGAELGVGTDTLSIHADNLLDSSANSFAFGAPTYSYGNREVTPLRPRTIRLGFAHPF